MFNGCFLFDFFVNVLIAYFLLCSLLGLTDDFYGDVKSLPLEENSAKDTGYTQRNGSGKSNKRKVWCFLILYINSP